MPVILNKIKKFGGIKLLSLEVKVVLPELVSKVPTVDSPS